MSIHFQAHAVFCAAAALFATTAMSEEIPQCKAMSLTVTRLEAPPSQYVEFCDREPDACVLDGEPRIVWTAEAFEQVSAINRNVNAEVTFIPDQENSGLEELWSFPEGGAGDCEDFVLEKRKRLVDLGFPGAALTCAIAFHEQKLFPHALLLVESTSGTWVLDNLDDEVLCWDRVPYFFTRRERPEGQWERFQQR